MEVVGRRGSGEETTGRAGRTICDCTADSGRRTEAWPNAASPTASTNARTDEPGRCRQPRDPSGIGLDARTFAVVLVPHAAAAGACDVLRRLSPAYSLIPTTLAASVAVLNAAPLDRYSDGLPPLSAAPSLARYDVLPPPLSSSIEFCRAFSSAVAFADITSLLSSHCDAAVSAQPSSALPW